MNITIIGAGPTGLYTALKLAEKHNVTLIEEHKEIGKPIQCTGILTEEITQYLTQKELKKITTTIVTETTIHSKNEEITIPISPNYIIDNAKYCQLLAKKARQAGVTILTETKYIHNNKKQILLKNNEGKTITGTADLLIGADGPMSQVAKNNKLYSKREFLTGIQARIKVNHYDKKIHFYPDRGAYAWYCPEGKGIARIGIAAKTKANQTFNEFIQQFPGQIRELQGGVIPLHKPNTTISKTYKDRTHAASRAQNNRMTVHLIGDAALHIKNTTGGGIIPGIKAAELLATNPLTYPKNLKRLNKELKTHYLLDKTLQKCNTKDWDKLLQQVNNEEIKTILKTTNRDNARKLLTQIIKKKPQLLLWAKKLF